MLNFMKISLNERTPLKNLVSRNESENTGGKAKIIFGFVVDSSQTMLPPGYQINTKSEDNLRISVVYSSQTILLHLEYQIKMYS
jgi:hypothetical protein